MTTSPEKNAIFLEESFQPFLSLDGAIHAENRVFEVRPTSRQVRLLRALAARKSGVLKKGELIGAMYGDILEQDPTMSMKSTSNRYQTAVKTLSRLRLELERYFYDLMPPGFDWLPWSERLGGWILFQQGSVNQARGI